MTAALPSRFFSTAALQPKLAVPAWRQYVAETFDDLDIRPGDGWNRGTVRDTMAGLVAISSVQADRQKVVRRRGGVAAGGTESVLLVLPRAGRVEVTQGRRSEAIAPGGACILNASDFYEASMSDATDLTMVKLPAHVLRARLGSLDDLYARPDIADPELVPMIDRFARDVALLSSARTAERLQGALIDLLTVLLDAGGRPGAGRSAALPDALLRQVTAFIETNLGDAALDAQKAADAIGISKRLLQKSMQRRGTTFGQEVMTARLHRADGMLRTTRRADRSIAQVAFACGFVSQAHFATRYRERFGAAPRDVRLAATNVGAAARAGAAAVRCAG